MQSSVRDRKSGAIEARRIPLQRPVELRYPLRDGYVIRSTLDLSMTGMFVQTGDPMAVGTTFSFRCRLDEHRPVEGIAEVRWIRDTAQGEKRPTGMGVRFLELDDASARAVRWLVEKHLHRAPPLQVVPDEGATASEETPETVGDATGGTSPAASTSHASPWGASAEWREEIRRRRQHRRTARILVAMILAVAVVALWLAAPSPIPLLSSQEPDPGTPAVRPEAPKTAQGPRSGAGLDQAEAVQGTAAGQARDPALAAEEDPLQSLELEVETFVEEWIGAWTGQRVDDYLGFYSAVFQPNGMGRATWEEERRTRVVGPDFIQVGVIGLSVEPVQDPSTGHTEARATFVQTYRSDMFRDTVLKTLELVREQDRWRILRESSEPIDS